MNKIPHNESAEHWRANHADVVRKYHRRALIIEELRFFIAILMACQTNQN